MTRRWIANTNIKVLHLVITAGKKEFLKPIAFTLKKGIRLLRELREAYGLLFSDINLKR